VLASPLRTGTQDVSIDLTGAVLTDLDLEECQIGAAKFEHAVFAGRTSFDQAVLGDVTFDGARFEANTSFGHTRFALHVGFDRAGFAGTADFGCTKVKGKAVFIESDFAGHAQFSSAATFACFAWMHDVWANPYQRSGKYEPSWPPGGLVDVDGRGNGWARVVPAPTVLLSELALESR
jgi:hypothetical protein